MRSCREFVEMVARMNKHGDMIEAAPGEAYPYQPDGCSDEDAQALYRLITEARGLVRDLPEDEPEECDCADRSWYGEHHDSACPLAGTPRDS